MTDENGEGATDPPNERPLNLPHDDWKEALREFLTRREREGRGDEEEGEESGNGDTR